MKKLILFALIALCMVTPAFAFPRICDMWWNGTSCNYTATGNDALNVSFRQTVIGDNLTVWINTAQWATHNATFNGDDYWHVFAPYDEVPPFQQGMNNVTMFVHTRNPSNDCTLTCWLNLTDTFEIPSEEQSLLHNLLADVGSGFGSLLDLITAPFVYMLLIFAMISSVFTIFYVIATMIKNSFR